MEELEYGRKLYKNCVIRDIELHESEALARAKLEDGTEPFCVLDFEGERYVRRDGWDLDQAALCVAALYEIDELIGDLSASPDAFSESSTVADSAKENNEDNSAEDDAEPKTEEVSNKAPERKPVLYFRRNGSTKKA